jgi:hypothetical protein
MIIYISSILTPVKNETIYDYKISKEYEKMFSQPSIWLGYQDFDPNNQPEKLIINN